MVAVYNISGPKSGTFQCASHLSPLKPLPLSAALAVQALVKAGASPADRDSAQRSVLHWAADAASHHSLNAIFSAATITQDLLDAQVIPIRFKCTHSLSPLTHTESRPVCTRPPSFRGQDMEGNTALHVAVERSSSACVEALMRHGASMRLRNVAGVLPCDVASHKIRKDMMESIAGVQCRSMVLCVPHPHACCNPSYCRSKPISVLIFSARYHAKCSRHMTRDGHQESPARTEMIVERIFDNKCVHANVWLDSVLRDNPPIILPLSNHLDTTDTACVSGKSFAPTLSPLPPPSKSPLYTTPNTSIL